MPNMDNVTEKKYGGIQNDAAKVSDAAGDMANQVKDKASQLGRTAAQDVAKASDAVGDMANQVKDQVKDKVSQLGRAAAEKADEGRVGTADVLQGSASSLRSAGQSSSEAISGAAGSMAEKLESSARYLRENDFRGMMRDLEHVVRRNPTQSIVTAIAVGFLAGAAVRNRS